MRKFYILACILAGTALLYQLNIKGESRNIASIPNFKTALIEKLKKNDFSCSGFSPLQTQACLLYVAAKGDMAGQNPEAYYAIEAMNAVPQIASSARYSIELYSLKEKFKIPDNNGEAIAESNVGICGHHATLFLEFMRLMEIPARPVQFYYSANGVRYSHIAAEAFIDGQWRYFDTTWAAFFLKDKNDPFSFASIEELLKGVPVTRFANAAQGWAYQAHALGVDVFDYLTSTPSVVYGYDSGTIKISNITPDTQKIDLSNLPNVIGDNNSDGPFEGIRYSFGPLPGTYAINVKVKASACNDETATFCVDNSCQSIRTDISFDSVKNPGSVYVKSTQNVCYIVLDSIALKKQ